MAPPKVEKAGIRMAHSRYKVVASHNGICELQVELLTGRTHQIRVHLSSIGLPLVGDRVYGRARGRDARLGRPALHAMRLGFEHPIRGQRLVFETSLPDDLSELALSLGPSEPAVGPLGDNDR